MKKRKPLVTSILILQDYYQPHHYGVMLADAIKAYPAYRLLTPAQKCVLFDLLRHIKFKLMYVDVKQAEDSPFPYTYKDCKEDISPSTFKAAMRELVRLGFVDKKTKHMSNRIAAPHYYTVAKAWQAYVPTFAERQEINQRNDWKARHITNEGAAKTALYQQICDDSAAPERKAS